MSAHSVHDAIVVGGGPAGSSCAWKLRGAGADVVVVDKQRFPRDKICAGWITPQIVAELGLDLAEYAAGGRTLQPIRGFAVSRLGDGAARVRYDDVVSYGIRRCEFDHYLLDRCGARLLLGEPVKSLRRDDGTWVVNDAVAAPVLIGAGGHFCPVAQHVGAALGRGETIVAAQEMEFAARDDQLAEFRVEADLPELFFTRDLKGYGWLVRKGRHLNIGLGRLDNRNLAEHVADFLASLRAAGKIPSDLPGRMRGHPYLLHDRSSRPLIGDGVMLAGDAAGLAYPRSGEGIRPAVESGLLAAQTVIAAGGRPRDSDLAAYERRVLDRFGPRKPGLGITDFLPPRLAGALAARLFASQWFAREVVLNRWFFHAAQPPLGA